MGVKLFDDVLSYIFVLGWSHSLTNDRPGWSTSMSHVCRQWRTIALDTGLLWTGLEFPVEPKTGWGRQTEWVRRSKEAPLDIHILGRKMRWPWESGTDTFSSIDAIGGILDIVLPYSNRWQSFACSSCSSTAQTHLLARLNSVQLPALTKLHISAPEDSKHLQGGTAVRLQLSSCQRLRHLVLSGGVIFDYKHLQLPELQTLRINDDRLYMLSTEELVQVTHGLLQQLPLVEEFDLQYSYPPYGWTTDLMHLAVPDELRQSIHATLNSIRPPTAAAFEVLVRYMAFTALVKIGDPAQSDDFGIPLSTFQVIAERAPLPALRSLRVHTSRDSSMNNDEDIKFWPALETMPLLERLHMQYMTFYPLHGGLMKLATICPSLGELALKACQGFTISELARIVNIRRESPRVSALHSLMVTYDPEFETDESAFKSLQESEDLYFSMSSY